MNWELLATQLDIPRYVVQQICAECLQDVDKSKLRLYAYWIENDKNASWEKLASALRMIKHKVLSDGILEKLTGISLQHCYIFQSSKVFAYHNVYTV